MLMPAMLPENLDHYKSAATDLQLLEQLAEKPAEFSSFFVAACDDENWRTEHLDFISQSLVWFSQQYLANSISPNLALPVAKSIKEHYLGLKEYLPKNIQFAVLDGQLPINSLVYQTASSFFHHILHKNCYVKGTTNFFLSGLYLSDLEIIDEHIYTDEVKDLWKLADWDLTRMIDICGRLDLKELSVLCQKIFSHRLDEQNVYATLVNAHQNSWEYLRNSCAENINNANLGVEISFPERYALCVYLENLTELSLDNFRKLSSIVTHIICGPRVAEERGFAQLLKDCPKLVSLDIGKTTSFSHQFTMLPEQLNELVISGSLWLNDSNFKLIVENAHPLQSLGLAGCNTLTASGWSELLKLSQLHHLDISSCTLLIDKELSLILDAAAGLTSLNVEGCVFLSESGFQALSKGKRIFEILNLARTNVLDESLVLITEQQQGLQKLNVAGCPHVTEAGIVESLRIGRNLKIFDCSYCSVPPQVIEELRKIYPHIHIIA